MVLYVYWFWVNTSVRQTDTPPVVAKSRCIATKGEFRITCHAGTTSRLTVLAAKWASRPFHVGRMLACWLLSICELRRYCRRLYKKLSYCKQIARNAACAHNTSWVSIATTWPWNLGYGSLKIIGNGTIRQIAYDGTSSY